MNASGQFQQMMNDRFLALQEFTDPYIDDILCGSRETEIKSSLEQHDFELMKLLEKMKEDKFYADRRKCKIFVDEVKFRGHILSKGTRSPAPGKLRAIEKWELPPTITAMRAFLGFVNQYSEYVKDFAEIVAPLQDKLKVSRQDGKKGSKKKIDYTPEDIISFEQIKRRLCEKMILQRVNPDKPFELRVDSSGRAVGAVLEQMEDPEAYPTVENLKEKKTVPVAFLSRKLTSSQRNWIPRELETYAIIVALQKWSSWIGLQPVLVLTDHQTLKDWYTENIDTPCGPVNRRARWLQTLSKFDLSVGYIPGKENTIADVLSRWAYPASEAFLDVSKHGSSKDVEELREILSREKSEEKDCMLIRLRHEPITPPLRDVRVTTRLGKNTQGTNDSEKMAECTRLAEEGGEEHPTMEACVPSESAEGNTFSGASDSNSSTDPPPLSDERQNPDIGPGQPLEGVFQNLRGAVWEDNWDEAYFTCPKWKETYTLLHGEKVSWPEGFKIFGDEIYFEERLCIPLSLQKHVIVDHHKSVGHFSGDKLWSQMCHRYIFADDTLAKKFTSQISSLCDTCQACNRQNQARGILEFTPVPPKCMVSVALDLFKMPPTNWAGQKYDTMAVCVDRHSGWMIATPHLEKGLTGAKVAKGMLYGNWRPFGIPSIITSDQGSHFVGSWWKFMCSHFGIRQAFSHAYHHQANR